VNKYILTLALAAFSFPVWAGSALSTVTVSQSLTMTSPTGLIACTGANCTVSATNGYFKNISATTIGGPISSSQIVLNGQTLNEVRFGTFNAGTTTDGAGGSVNFGVAMSSASGAVAVVTGCNGTTASTVMYVNGVSTTGFSWKLGNNGNASNNSCWYYWVAR
jgi:hypothetical protein